MKILIIFGCAMAILIVVVAFIEAQRSNFGLPLSFDEWQRRIHPDKWKRRHKKGKA